MDKIPPHRIGYPSPLVFHLSAAVLGYQAAIIAAQKGEPLLDQQVLGMAVLQRLKSFQSGLEKWQSHPYRRTTQLPPSIWDNGATSLLDYGNGTSDAPVVLVVPSLINRAYILDLNENTSLMRYLVARGLRPLLLDWGSPGDAERGFDLDAYTRDRLLPAIDAAKDITDGDIGILGYCMGGTLSAGVLATRPEGISAFATIGSPWDFSASRGVAANLRSMISDPSTHLDQLGQVFGMVPTEVFQLLFSMINPMQAAIKFRNFDAKDMNSEAAFHFAAIEDWLADGVPVPTPAAKNLLIDWNINNNTGNGRWELLGTKVDLADIHIPSLTICGLKDSITPIDVATPLGNRIPDCTILTPDTGHVGMIVGSKAKSEVWAPLANFLRTNLS